MAGLFDTFTIAKRGLSVQQSSIDVTSHNIANTNTTGYTRQRAVSETTEPRGGNTKFDDLSVGQVGTGAQITSIERIRDSFIDYQVRTQATINSSLDTQNTYLQQAVDVIDDTNNTGVKSALDNFYTAFQSLSTSSDKDSSKAVAVTKAETLASQINDSYNNLKKIQDNLQNVLTSDVTTINDTLDQINDLNKQIESVTSLGLTPNDLMDKRDNLLDTLSEKFGISIDSQKNNGVDVSATDLSSSNILVNSSDTTGTKCTRFSSVESVEYDSTSNELTIKYAKLGNSDNTFTTTVTLSGSAADGEALKESLEKDRILIASNDGTVNLSSATDVKSAIFKASGGEVGGDQVAQDAIQTSMNGLDEFAAALAYTVNSIQTGSTDGTANSNLSNNDSLFVVSGSSSDSGITAANISVNSALQSDSTLLNCASDSSSGEKDGSRALAIADLADLKIDFTTLDSSSISGLTRAAFFSKTGLTFKDSTDTDLNSTAAGGTTLDDNFTSVTSTLGTAANTVSNKLTTSENLLTSLKDQRTSVSGVSLDEEMTNLIEYQHAYQANAKVISTVDQLLDVVINGLKSS
ncbi:flagellar hook-associated protein FlgK [Clostridium sp.]|uniref:flagellar hook-associated protein FlgK n=1 Tax=Clostridium sp. TaxID=1506 RepID=UPI002617EC89|nr:flagellar hook-associated protein FlgK [Clostridium sp.]